MKTKDTLQEQQNHWNSIKEEFIKHVPEAFPVEIEWGKNHYIYRVIIETPIGTIKGQSNEGHNAVYGMDLQREVKGINNGFVNCTRISINGYEMLSKILNGVDEVAPILEGIQKQQENLMRVKHQIDQTLENLNYYAFSKILTEQELKRTRREIKNGLETLLINLENNRLL